LYGQKDVKLNLIRKAYPDVTITSRGHSLKISGSKKEAQQVKSRFEMMVKMLKEYNEFL